MENLGDLVPVIRRSVLSVPADNQKAIRKIPVLDCDAVIFDLEDSVAPEKKAEARNNVMDAFRQNGLPEKERIIRINALSSPFGRQDLELVMQTGPDAVLIPKVEHSADVAAVADILSDANTAIDIWAMIETPKGLLNIPSIAAAGKPLSCFVVGLNDLRKETGVPLQPGRTYLVPWLMQVVLAGRAYGIDVIDSVFNDFRDEAGYDAECAQGRAMGFSGKMLIHPAQIEPANRYFGPEEGSIEEAKIIVAAFDKPEARSLNVINLDGRMVERLHLLQAKALLAKAEIIAERKKLS